MPPASLSCETDSAHPGCSLRRELPEMSLDLTRQAFDAFRSEAASRPLTSLRGGYALDSYEIPRPFDVVLDRPTDEYLERYAFWGLAHLDPLSWRHYLPRLMEYALHHPKDSAMVVEGLLFNLRPPDREPPRLGSLSGAQEAVVAAFLRAIAAAQDSGNREFAEQVLQEWWVPGALHRPGPV